MSNALKTWAELLKLGAGYLDSKEVPDATVAMELLMARLLTCGRGFLTPHLDKTPSPKYVDALRRGMARLVTGEPIQYVIGEWDFRRLTLKCDQRALIPRPETEALVTRVLAFLQGYVSSVPRPFVVDMGTGTGCIALSIASEFPQANCLGIDISEKAISLAKENAALCGLTGRVKFACADGFDDFDEPESVDVVVSNPPYIATAECTELDPRIRNFEPSNALDGGATGLDFYERFIPDAMNVLRVGGAAFFEIGDGQGERVQKLFFECGFSDVHIEKDFSGHERYAWGVLKTLGM